MRNPWSAFYWRDYAGDTSHLSLIEHGAYLMLMSHYYITGQPLPANAEQLQRICRAFAAEELEAISVVLARFFWKDGETYRHTRIDKELAKSSGISDKRRKAAQTKHANAEQMYIQVQSKCTASAEQMHTQSQSQSHTQESKSKACVTQKRDHRTGTRIPEDFIPKDQHYKLARELGINCEMEFQKFRDHFLGKSGSGAVKTDWDATLRNWLRNSLNFGGGGHGREPSKKQQRTRGNQELLVEEMLGAEIGLGGEGDELRTGGGGTAALGIGSGRLLGSGG